VGDELYIDVSASAGYVFKSGFVVFRREFLKCSKLLVSTTVVHEKTLTRLYASSDAKISQLPPGRTGGDHRDTLALCGCSLSSKTLIQ